MAQELNGANYILAIDGGGSRTRCMAVDPSGRVLAESETGPSNHLVVDMPSVRRSLADATRAAIEQSGVSRREVLVSAGMAGVDYDGRGAEEIESLLSGLGFPNALVNGDMAIAHAGALGGNPGVVALAGTGSCVLGIDDAGRRVKVGGWGPVYGDEGSAYRIGQAALIAAARAYDGRGPATALLPAILKTWELSSFDDSLDRVYVGRMEAREIAALSPLVGRVAAEGDECARLILKQAGEELAEAVIAAARRLGIADRDVPVSWQGALIESCEPVRRAFAGALPSYTLLAPQFSPVAGAYLLGAKALGWEPKPCIARTT